MDSTLRGNMVLCRKRGQGKGAVKKKKKAIKTGGLFELKVNKQ